MSKIYSFHIKVQDGSICFKSATHEQMFHNWLSQWNDEEIGLEVIEKKSKRSEQQNRYLWLYYGVISKETGYTEEEIHEWAKGTCLPTSIKEIFGNKVRVKKSTTGLTISEMMEFIINIETKTGILTPDTTDFLGFSYHK